jgi:8-oxo-dGTP diphosphatase
MAAANVDLRCSTILFRKDTVLLVHRSYDGLSDWVLPGGTPRAGESMVACARREMREETGMIADPTRVAFVLEAMRPDGQRRTVDLVFIAPDATASQQPEQREPGLEPVFVSLAEVPALDLRPPIGGHLRGLRTHGVMCAPYLGNLWRPAAASTTRMTQGE